MKPAPNFGHNKDSSHRSDKTDDKRGTGYRKVDSHCLDG